MKKRIILFILPIIIILIIFFTFFNLKKNDSKLDVFFFKNDKEKYYLFDSEGNRLTNEEYDKVLDFILSSTLVYKDDRVSIIDKSGKVLKDEDDYSEILRYASFYKANKDDKTYLLDNMGNMIKDITDTKVVSFKGANKFIIVENKDTYDIIFYNGKNIYTFNRIDDNLPTINQIDNLSSIFYNDETIIIDNTNGKVLYKVNGNIHYCINSKNDDVIILNTCSATYQERISYKVIDNDNIKDIDKSCSNVSLNGNNILCEKDNEYYLLDEYYKLSLQVTSSISYNDDKNYIKEHDNKIDFISNKKIVNSISNAHIKTNGYQEGNYYILSIDNKYYYYDNLGNKMFDEVFDDANNFDSNGYALVKNNDLEYLIDKKGNSITDKIESIISYKDFYIISKDKIGLIDKNGKKILDMEYDDIKLLDDNNHNYSILKNISKYMIYDIDNKKIISTYDEEIENFSYYYRVGNKYYTYNGKLIYEK